MVTILNKVKGVGRELDNYRLISLLNKELKILVMILRERLQSVVVSLAGPE